MSSNYIEVRVYRCAMQEVWIKRPVASKKSLLVWDSFKAHLTDKLKSQLKKGNSEYAVIPGGLTSIVQPLDVCVNKQFLY